MPAAKQSHAYGLLNPAVRGWIVTMYSNDRKTNK